MLTIFSIDETMFLKYSLKIIPIILFILIKLYYDKKKFQFMHKINMKSIILLLSNLAISILTTYLFLLLFKNYSLSKIIPLISPIIIILTIFMDKLINKKKFSMNYYLGIIFIIIII